MHNDPKMSKSVGAFDTAALRRKSSRNKPGQTFHARTNSTLSTSSSTQDDDDSVSVDSEVGLIYVPGMKMNDEEAKNLLKQLTDKKKRIEQM